MYGINLDSSCGINITSHGPHTRRPNGAIKYINWNQNLFYFHNGYYVPCHFGHISHHFPLPPQTPSGEKNFYSMFDVILNGEKYVTFVWSRRHAIVLQLG